MKTERNTMSKCAFLLWNLFFGVAAWFIFYPFLSHQILSLGWRVSVLCALFLVFVFMETGIVLTIQRQRNAISIFLNTALPYEICLAVLFQPNQPVFCTVSAVAAGILSFLFVLYVFTRQNNDRKTRQTMSRRLQNGFRGARFFFCVCLAVFVVPSSAARLFGYTIVEYAAKSEAVPASSPFSPENYLETIGKYKEDVWFSLALPEKVEAMQVITDAEGEFLGVTKRISVEVGAMENISIAQYDNAGRKIIVNEEYIGELPPEDVLESLCHEMYHAYQICLCELYDYVDEKTKNLLDFRKISVYREEFRHYIDGSENLAKYYNQTIERDAREYAAEACEKYLELIDEY